MRADRALLLRSLDLLTTAVLVVDVDGTLGWANRAGCELLDRADGVALVDGRVEAVHSESQVAWRQMLAKANAARRKGPCHAVVFRRQSGWFGYQAAIRPNVDASQPHIVFVTDPTRDLAGIEICIRQMYGLTRGEADVATQLAGGADLAQIADARNVSRQTIRTQLRQIFEKTGTRRQVDLVRLVLGLSTSCCDLP